MNEIQSLELCFLGSPRILLGGKIVEPDTRKATAMLAFLAITGQPQTREILASLLYPEYDDSHARGALRRTLFALKKVLPDGQLHASKQQIELTRSNAIDIDVDRYESLIKNTRHHAHFRLEQCRICLSKLELAAEIYQGDFLSGFYLRDSPPFDDWVFFKRDGLRRDFAYVLQSLAASYNEIKDYTRAIEIGVRWLSLDPLVEDAHRELMRSYALSGQRNAALRQYQKCQQILEKELGVSPLEETTSLYQTILNYEIDPNIEQRRAKLFDFSYDTSSSKKELKNSLSEIPPGGIRYPLVGRSRESEKLIQAYRRFAKDGFFMVLEGEVGIGKTRLGEEFLASIQSQGAVTIEAHCFEREINLAFGPLVDAIDGALSEGDFSLALNGLSDQYLSEGSRLFPTLNAYFPQLKQPPPLSNPGAQSLFYDGLRHLILRLFNGQIPGVLFIDDIHWIDSASLDFLSYFIHRIAGESIFILATIIKEDEIDYSSLDALIAEAQRSGRGSILELKRLQKKDVQDLLRVVENQVDSLPCGLDDRLFTETEGLPYFLVEYLDSMLHNVRKNGNPGVDGIDWKTPESIKDILRIRIQHVDQLGHQLLTTAAVIGRSFEFDTLLSASGRSEMETITGLETLLSHRLIEECSNCDNPALLQYDFTHEKLRSLVYEEMSLTRRRLLHYRIAEALLNQRHSRINPGSLENKIAEHYRLAGQELLAAEHYKQAGDYARTLFANREAISLYESAIASGYQNVGEVFEAIGDLQTLFGNYPSALENYEVAQETSPNDQTDGLRLKIGHVYQREGEWDAAIDQFECAYQNIDRENQPSLAAQILVDWSLAAYQKGEADTSIKLAEQALSFAEMANDMRPLAQAHNLLGILARYQGDLKRATNELDKSLQIASDSGDDVAEAAALNNLALVLAETNNIDKAIQTTIQALNICNRLGDLHHVAALNSNLADLLHKSGKDEQAMEHLKKAVSMFAKIGEQSIELQPEIWKLTEW